MAQTRSGRAVQANRRLELRATNAGYAAALSRLLRTRGGASLLARPRGVTEAEPVKFGLRQVEIVGTNVGKSFAVSRLLHSINSLMQQIGGAGSLERTRLPRIPC